MLKALRDKSATTLAEALWSVISVFGPPLRITSDGKASNMSSILESMIAAHGIEHRTVAAYVPRQNGKAEAHVQIALTVVRRMLSECGPDWPVLLGAAALIIKKKHRSLINIDPFRLVFCRAALAFAACVDIADTNLSTDQRQLPDFLLAKDEQLSHLWPLAARQGRMLEQQAKYNELFKSKHVIAASLPIGTTVLSDEALHMLHLSSALIASLAAMTLAALTLCATKPVAFFLLMFRRATQTDRTW